MAAIAVDVRSELFSTDHFESVDILKLSFYTQSVDSRPREMKPEKKQIIFLFLFFSSDEFVERQVLEKGSNDLLFAASQTNSFVSHAMY